MNALVNLRNSLPRRQDIFYPFEDHFNKLFDQFFNDKSVLGSKIKSGYPKLDVFTTDGKWVVEVAVPGIEADNLSVEIENGMLKISGHMEEKNHSTDTNWQVKELRRSSFERIIPIPEEIKGDPEVTLKDGLLTLIWGMPEIKKQEIKKIPINKSK